MLRPPGGGFNARTARIDPPDTTQPGHGDLRIDGHDCARIRRMDLSVSAGSGLSPVEGDDAAPVALPMSWLRSRGINADLAVLVRVQGDCMAPAIPDGGFVLIHLPEKQVLKPAIYAFTREGQSFVKRLIPSGFGDDGRPSTIMIIADNPAFPPEAVSGRALNGLRVVGRIRAVLSMVD